MVTELPLLSFPTSSPFWLWEVLIPRVSGPTWSNRHIGQCDAVRRGTVKQFCPLYLLLSAGFETCGSTIFGSERTVGKRGSLCCTHIARCNPLFSFWKMYLSQCLQSQSFQHYEEQSSFTCLKGWEITISKIYNLYMLHSSIL